jgi:hypothetical protein
LRGKVGSGRELLLPILMMTGLSTLWDQVLR